MFLWRKQIGGSRLLRVLVPGHGSGCQLWAVWWLVEFRQQKQPLPCFLGQRYKAVRVNGRWETKSAPIHHSEILEMLRGVTWGNQPRLTGGPSWGGGGQLEANVFHHDRSIVALFSHVLLCTGGLDLTLTVSLSLHITLNIHHPSEKSHKIE